MTTRQRMLLEPDSRGRVPLAKLGVTDDRVLYLAEVKRDGTITLTPAAVVPASQVKQDGSPLLR